MLNSTEHEIFPAHNVKMPTNVGILTFMSGKNSILYIASDTFTVTRYGIKYIACNKQNRSDILRLFFSHIKPAAGVVQR